MSLLTPDRIVSQVGSRPEAVPLSIVVTEAGASGDAGGWSVTIQASDFVDAAGDHLSSADLVDRDNQLSQAGGGGTALAVSPSGPLDQPETVLTDQGEDSNRLYTGSFTDTSELLLTPPEGTRAGMYTSVITVTLFS